MASDFLSLFPPTRISFDLASENKKQVVEGLLELAIQDLDLNPQARGALLRKLMDREKNGSTGVGAVAIPHVKAKSVTRTIGAFGVFPNGIDFQAVDDNPVYCVFLLVSPEDQADEHLQALRWIAQVVRKPDFIRFARQLRDPGEACGLLEEMGG